MELNRKKIRRNYSSELNYLICLILRLEFLSFYLHLTNLLFVHSPCASKPIKQRVEAFEKLQTPQKETRTRTRVLTAESEVSAKHIFFE